MFLAAQHNSARSAKLFDPANNKLRLVLRGFPPALATSLSQAAQCDHPFPHSSHAAVIPAKYYPTALKELLQWHIETNGDHLVSDHTACTARVVTAL